MTQFCVVVELTSRKTVLQRDVLDGYLRAPCKIPVLRTVLVLQPLLCLAGCELPGSYQDTG